MRGPPQKVKEPKRSALRRRGAQGGMRGLLQPIAGWCSGRPARALRGKIISTFHKRAIKSSPTLRFASTRDILGEWGP